jgi:RNA polymerase sigma-70 factor, ECF subfamily
MIEGVEMAPELTDVQTAVEAASAEETAKITATLIRITGGWSLAEDCVQDAFARALSTGRSPAFRGIPGRG